MRTNVLTVICQASRWHIQMQDEDGAMRVCRASACENGHSAFLATHDCDEPDYPALHC